MDLHYCEPRLVALYDTLNAGNHELTFYAPLMGEPPKRIIDLGCGTGATAARLSDIGHFVTGVDPANEMLEVARSRTSTRVDWVLGDLQSLPDQTRADIILMTGHAFQCLLTNTELEATLGKARALLPRGGRLMFESRNPGARAWEQWTPGRTLRSVSTVNRSRVEVFENLLGIENNLVTFETHYRFVDLKETLVSRSTLRFLSRAEIGRHLQLAGFVDVRCFGDWDGSAFAVGSPEIIIVAS